MGYRRVDPTVFKQRYQESQERAARRGASYWKPKAGQVGKPFRNVVRVLPPHESMEEVFQYARIHFSLGPNGDTAVGCLEAWGKSCEACANAQQLFDQSRAETDPKRAVALKEQASTVMAKDRWMANVVDMSAMEQGVQVWAFGPDVEQRLRQCFYDDNGEFRDVTDPEQGRDIIVSVSKKKSTDFNQYDEVRCKEVTSALEDMDWLEQMKDLTLMSVEPAEADVAGALQGVRPSGATESRSPATTAPTLAKAPPPAKTAPPPAAKAPPPSTKPPVSAGKPAAKPSAAAVKPAQRAPALSRQPVGETVGGDGGPYQNARAHCASLGVEAFEITPEEVDAVKGIPPCFKLYADAGDQACQGCKLLLPCLEVVLSKA